MFNFLFDGKIGDILAPVVPSNQLFLAIQHHRNAEIPTLLSTSQYDPNRIADGGYAAIHVACRYNNRYAVGLLLSKGTPPTLVDRNGDTPLHYAAKYGNLDICKFLIENGAAVHTRNNSHQTCYDVAESHLVRQYLLPLVLQAERANGVAPPEHNLYGGMSGMGQHSYSAHTPAQPPLAVPPPPTFPGQTISYQQPAYYAAGLATPAAVPPSVSPPPAEVSPSPPPIPSVPVTAPLPSAGVFPNTTQAGAGGSRVIVPDGFHSSASDPVLQQKYGHIIERPTTAPPPTSFPVLSTATPGVSIGPPPPLYPSSGVGPPTTTVFQRYVPYDPHTNGAAAVPAFPHPAPNPYVHAYPPGAAPAAYAAPHLQGQQASAPLQQHPAPLPHAPAAHASAPPESVPPSASTTANTVSPSHSHLTNRLLGNKAIQTFNPATDTTVIVDAQSTSSSIL